MTCRKCGSQNVTVQIEQVSGKTKTNHTGILHAICRWTLILCTLGLWLLVPSRATNSKTKFKSKTVAICQDCGHKWTVKG